MRHFLPLLLLIALAGCEEPKPKAKAKAKAVDKQAGGQTPANVQTPAKRIIAGMEEDRRAAAPKEPEAKPDSRWIDEARLEYLAAIQAKGRRLRANAQRLGGMNVVERMQGLQSARMVKEHGVGKLPGGIVDAAERFAPEFVGTMKRDEAIRLGELPGYPDQKRRKEHWDKLSKAVGPLDGNHNLGTFATLSEKEMDAAHLAAQNAANGLGKLSPEERGLLLAVGALEWFDEQLEAEKPEAERAAGRRAKEERRREQAEREAARTAQVEDKVSRATEGLRRSEAIAKGKVETIRREKANAEAEENLRGKAVAGAEAEAERAMEKERLPENVRRYIRGRAKGRWDHSSIKDVGKLSLDVTRGIKDGDLGVPLYPNRFLDPKRFSGTSSSMAIVKILGEDETVIYPGDVSIKGVSTLGLVAGSKGSRVDLKGKLFLADGKATYTTGAGKEVVVPRLIALDFEKVKPALDGGAVKEWIAAEAGHRQARAGAARKAEALRKAETMYETHQKRLAEESEKARGAALRELEAGQR